MANTPTPPAAAHVSEIFDPSAWREVPGFAFDDITYHRSVEHGTVRIAFNRPEVRNAFRPKTVHELLQAFDLAHEDPAVGVIILTGAGDLAFCSGGDQKQRAETGDYGPSETGLFEVETLSPIYEGMYSRI